MSESEKAKQIARDVEKTNNENASELKGAMNGGCSPELTKQATGTMAAVMGVVDKVNRALTTTGSGGGGGGGGSGGASSPSVVKKARSKLAEGGCEAAFDELLAGKERRLEEELNMLSKMSEKTRGLASAHNLKREKLSPSGQYNQLLSQQTVNNAAIVKNGLVNNESCLKERCVIASFFEKSIAKYITKDAQLNY